MKGRRRRRRRVAIGVVIRSTLHLLVVPLNTSHHPSNNLK